MPKPTAGKGLPSEFFNEVIVSASAAYGALRADAGGDNFEYRAGIIVQPADDIRIDNVFHAAGVETALESLEMCTAIIAEVIKRARCAAADFLAAFLFAVKNAHGVALKPVLTGFAHAVDMRFQIIKKSLVVFPAAFSAADAVKVQRQLVKPQPSQKGERKHDDFRIGFKGGRTEKLNAELMMFAKPSRLRLFIAENRSVEIIHLLGKSLVEEPGFQGRREPCPPCPRA